MNKKPEERPVYVISVAAEILCMHPQTLRLYERKGLVSPKRQGKNRLYSELDLQRLRYIQRLTQEFGINLAGVEMITRLEQEVEKLRLCLEKLNFVFEEEPEE